MSARLRLPQRPPWRGAHRRASPLLPPAPSVSTPQRRAPLAVARRSFSGALGPEDVWPDGTPKKFRGKDAWKNWIRWDSPFRDQTDELNRQRHFFFEVDNKGALWRLELDRPGERFGQLRHAKAVDAFLSHIQQNVTGHFESLFPFVSLRTHEHYFVRWAADAEGVSSNSAQEAAGSLDALELPRVRRADEAPIVFNDLRDGELRHILDGHICSSVTTPFDPSALRLTLDGRLLHPVWTTLRHGPTEADASAAAASAPGSDARGRGDEQRPRKVQLLASLDVATAQSLLADAEYASAEDGGIVLQWAGEEYMVQTLSESS
eukprot:TRINITY_DN73969_c0_g1_i1.p1 TRINITY_DN73969_c0_g1~~TRINITY_DN73969_c0_g1_i1.p1  ORF type:complete len:320 (-),score=62.99 TRINITY_DN73969_c0_g1_i1:39-998(-)